MRFVCIPMRFMRNCMRIYAYLCVFMRTHMRVNCISIRVLCESDRFSILNTVVLYLTDISTFHLVCIWSKVLQAK